jgi:ribonuclease E
VAQISQQLAASAAGVTTENMGEKVRVHALAKALGVPSAEMIAVLDSQGYGGKKATSTLPKADVETVLTSLRAAVEPEKGAGQEEGHEGGEEDRRDEGTGQEGRREEGTGR